MRSTKGSSRWVRHVVVASLVATVLVAGIASRHSAGLAVGALDGDAYGFLQKSNFKTSSGRLDFRFAYHSFGKQVAFGVLGPFTFGFIDAGTKFPDGARRDLTGTYAETATPDCFTLTFDSNSDNDIDLRVREQLIKDAKSQGIRGLDAQTVLDLPAIDACRDIEGRLIMDLPALQLQTPPSHTFYRNKEKALTGGSVQIDGVVADELPKTGPSDVRTAATGTAVAVVAIGALWWQRRRLELAR